MKSTKVQVSYKNKELLKDVKVALSLYSRMKGLLGTKKLKAEQALLINNCKQVHTFFMQYPIDVAFLDSKNKILKIQSLKPWAFSSWVYKSAQVLETQKGFFKKNNIQVGERLGFKKK